MALLDSEGLGLSTSLSDFTTYGVLTSRGTSVVSGHQQITTGGPLGDNVLDLLSAYTGGETPVYERVFPSVVSTFFFGCRSCFSGSGGGSGGYQFTDVNGVIQFTVKIDPSGGVTAYRGYSGTSLNSAGTSLGSTAAVFPIDGVTYNYIEIGAVVATGSGGSIIIKNNGVVVLSVTTANTQSSGTAGVGRVQFFTDNSFGQKTTHVYLCDGTGSAPWNTYLGDVRVQTLLPTSNDAVAFTPHGNGANWQNAAQIPPAPGSDYNSDTVIGDQDTFNCASVGSGLSTIYGLNVKGLFQKTDAGGRQMQTVMKSGGTTSLGPATAIGTTTGSVRQMYELDPNTSAQWTQTNANSAKPGYKINS